MLEEKAARRALVDAGRDLFERGLLVSIEGNLSVRIDGGLLATTPSGVHKGRMSPAEIVVCDATGTPRGSGRPSSELPMHLAILEEREDVQAIVHAHPTHATGWAVSGRQLPTAALAESLVVFGDVPTARYATPSTRALADSVRASLRQSDAALLAHHGAVTVGPDLATAIERMAMLEHLAAIAFVAEAIGGARNLGPAEIEALSELRERSGAGPIPAVCYPPAGESGTITLTRDELVRLIADAARAVD